MAAMHGSGHNAATIEAPDAAVAAMAWRWAVSQVEMTMSANGEWTNVDVETLSDDTQVLYSEFKDRYRKAQEAKREFEDAMQAEFAEFLPSGQELKFGYKFGKLSVSTGPKVERKPAASKRPSLESFLEKRAANGQGY